MYSLKASINILKYLLPGAKVGFYASLIILLITSCLVGYQGAMIQSFNFDHLIDNYLFDSTRTFSEAVFPAAHTFMLKWPLFALGGIFGNSKEVFTVLTILVYLASVFGLLVIIYYATKRNRTITTLVAYLLSILLLLIPAQQSPGDVMPVNMAMLTTRNIEYVLYILFCYFAIKSKRLFDANGYVAFFLILILTLSDKLLFYIAILTTLMVFIYQIALAKRFHINQIFAVVYTGLAFVASFTIIKLINVLHITTINSDNASISTTTQDSMRSIFTSTLDAIEALMRNFGANIFKDQPSVTLFMSMIGLVMLGVCLYAMARLLSEKRRQSSDIAHIVGRWLVFSSLAALIMYVGIARGDGISVRYLSIFVFAGVYALALWLNEISPGRLVFVSNRITLATLIVIPIAILLSIHNTNLSIEKSAAVAGIKDASYISKSLNKRGVNLLVGVYYVSALTRYDSNNMIKIAPTLDYGCIPSPTNYLTSRYWYSTDGNVRTAALYVIDDKNEKGSINNGCSTIQLENVLGVPTEVIKIPNSSGELYVYNYDIRNKLFNH